MLDGFFLAPDRDSPGCGRNNERHEDEAAASYDRAVAVEGIPEHYRAIVQQLRAQLGAGQ